MKSFNDAQGEPWDVVITIEQLQKVRSRLDLCLVPLELEDALQKRVEADFERLRKDHALFLELVFTLVEDQARARGVDRRAFGERIDFGTFMDARAAVDEEVTVFTQSRPNKDRVRAAMQKRTRPALEALGRAQEEVARQAETGELWGLPAASSSTASATPASAASIPAG